MAKEEPGGSGTQCGCLRPRAMRGPGESYTPLPAERTSRPLTPSPAAGSPRLSSRLRRRTSLYGTFRVFFACAPEKGALEIYGTRRGFPAATWNVRSTSLSGIAGDVGSEKPNLWGNSMDRKSLVMTSFLLSALVASSAPALAGVELVTNGGFESNGGSGQIWLHISPAGRCVPRC